MSTALYLDFWTSFNRFCGAKGTFLNPYKPRDRYYTEIRIGRRDITLLLTASIQKKQIGSGIYLKGGGAKRAFHLLISERAGIEAKMGQVEWHELPQKQDCRITRYLNGVDISREAEWQRAFEWLINQAELFHKTFSPHIQALPL